MDSRLADSTGQHFRADRLDRLVKITRLFMRLHGPTKATTPGCRRLGDWLA